MPMSSRAALAAGFSLAGLVALVGPSLGQQPDSSVRKTSVQTTFDKPAVTAVLGTVDMEYIFKEYKKVQVANDNLKAELSVKEKELTKLLADGQAAVEQLKKLKPGTTDYEKLATKVTQIKAEIDAGREQGNQRFAIKGAETMATIYDDVQKMVAAVAGKHKMTYVVRISNGPVAGSDPEMVMAAMARPVIYSDPNADISKEVVAYLNYNYERAGGATTKAATAPSAGTSKGAK